MATIALPRPIPAHHSTDIAAFSPPLSLDAFAEHMKPEPVPVPNKHIPVCPPGPVPREEPNTPPPSPRKDEHAPQSSLLFPPDKYARIGSTDPILYRIEPHQVAAAVDHVSRQALPEPSEVFPWLHGLHPQNQIQNTFFLSRRRGERRAPTNLRGVTLVKADGDLATSKLKGALSYLEFMRHDAAEFLEVDPREGFSVRNFQIQAAKGATTSDVIIYGEVEAIVYGLGRQIAAAQQAWYERYNHDDHVLPTYNAFACVCPFAEFESRHPEIVAVDTLGQVTGNVVDFFQQERREMYELTKASEISHNVWLGQTPDPDTDEEMIYDVLVECSDLGTLNPLALQTVFEESRQGLKRQVHVEFPSSGSILPPIGSHEEADGILTTCKWIYHLAHGTFPEARMDSAGDIVMDTADVPTNNPSQGRKILIHCADGYTESTMLGIAYFSYSTGLPIPQAWLELHTEKKRAFFAYPPDVALLTTIAPRLLLESPVCANKSLEEVTDLIKNEPKWMTGLDGSFPSRVLDYMYLGNLGHANNPELLRALGIGQILSVGETTIWRDGELGMWGEDNICLVQGVQDNGIDSLADEFERCLEFIDRGRKAGTATLVHCRVGVSRSATICIAEVMRELDLSFARAYCFVRARRLNVIIQPHLRFAYELLKWEELLQGRKTSVMEDACTLRGFKRELEWASIAREIAAMNRPYAR